VIAIELTPVDREAIDYTSLQKPLIYYILRIVGIFAAIAAGILAGKHGEYRRLNGLARAALWVLIIDSIIWAFIAYDMKDILSGQLFSLTGPFVWLSCILILAGMDRSVWKVLDPLIIIISYITAVFALKSLIIICNYLTEDRWGSAPAQYMVLLMWFAGWTFLSSWSCSGWKLCMRWFPYIVFIIGAILTRTRSWLIMSFLLFIFFLLISKSANTIRAHVIKKFMLFAILLTIIFTSGFLIFQDQYFSAYDRFMERITEDSRSEQYEAFFSQVPVTDLILGGGPKATWSEGEGKYFSEYQYLDNQYIWMAFLGGLPTLVSYVILIILPGLKAYHYGARKNDAAAAVLIILWGLVCAGLGTFSNPTIGSYSFFICLLAGRCHGYNEEIKMNSNR
jgi:hypothetical protein